MKLPQNDAFALKRAMMQLPTLDNVPTSALVRSIVTQNNPQIVLSLINLLETDLVTQIHKTDPNAIPEIAGKLIHASKLDTLPPIKWLIRGEIPEKGLTVLFGASGGGKSFLALDYALRIAQTHPVLYLAAEGQSGYPQRVKAWSKYNRSGVGSLYLYLDQVSIANDSEFDSFVAEIGYIAPVFIVVDTVAQTMTGYDENSARDMGLYLRACKRLQKHFDCAVMLVHHTNKGGVDERGSGALRGASDSMLRLTPEDDTLILEASKSKDSRPFEPRYLKQVEVPLGQDEDGLPISSLVLVEAEKVTRTGDRLTNNEIKIISLLGNALHEDGLGFSEIIELTNIPKTTAYRALSALYEMDLLTRGKAKTYVLTSTGKEKFTAFTKFQSSTSSTGSTGV